MINNYLFDELNNRVLMTPGPAEIYPEVLIAIGNQACSSDDPVFKKLEIEIREMLKEQFQTSSEYTYVISGSGTIAMETVLFNTIHSNGKILICNNGIFGSRLVEICNRCQAKFVVLEDDWGKPVDISKVSDIISQDKSIKAIIMVHGETSTGVVSDIQAVGALTKNTDILFIVDAHTTLGGMPIKVDEWGIDICYSGSQKCFSAPSGMAPITFSLKAIDAINRRTSPSVSWFNDIDNAFLTDFSGKLIRRYHHTPPSNLLYGLHKSLSLLKKEGRENVFERHRLNANILREGLRDLDIELFVPDEYFLPQIHVIRVPENFVNSAEFCEILNKDYNLQVSTGLGVMQENYIRIGLVGYGSRKTKIDYLLKSFSSALIKSKSNF